MKKLILTMCLTAAGVFGAAAQMRLTLGEALDLALSENPTVKVAEMEVQRFDYVKRQTGLPDEDIFQVLIEFGCQRSIYILRLDREIGYRNGLYLIIIDRRSVKLIGNSARNDYQRQAEQ